jgi:hypothetical protein
MADGQIIGGTTIGNIFSGTYLFFQAGALMTQNNIMFIMSVILFFLAAGAHITTIRKNTKK